MSSSPRFRLVWVVLVVCLAAGAVQMGAQTVAARGFMWKVERAGRVGYLAGSLHMLTPDAYPLPASMTRAFDSSDTLMEEADLDELTSPAFAATVLSRALYLDGRTLQDEVSPETFRFIRERAGRAGLPLEALQRMKPWMVAVTLQGLELSAGGFDPALGVDRFFFDRAKRTNVTVLPLEAAIDQIAYLERLGPSLQDTLVKEQVENAAAEVTTVKQMAAAWRSGDAVALEALALGDLKDAPAIYQALIVERNRNWLPKVRSCFETRRCFVVVGAAHLLGPDGLLAALRGQGYTVTQQ